MKSLICIVCPRGCHLQVDTENDYMVTGNACPRGAEYGKTELTNPTRVLTSIVKIEGAIHPCCPVKTSGAVPKHMIFECMEAIRSVDLQAPIALGSVIIKDVCGTGIDWIACKEM